MSQPSKALKVPSNNGTSPVSGSASSLDPKGAADLTTSTAVKPEDMSSPHELTSSAETLLSQLEHKFDAMSAQLQERMSQMSAQVDDLESSVQCLIKGDASVPQSPVQGTQSSLGRKSTS